MEGKNRVTLPPIEISFGRLRCPTADFKAFGHLPSGSWSSCCWILSVFCLSWVPASHTIHTSAIFSLWKKHTFSKLVLAVQFPYCALCLGQTFTQCHIYVTCMPLLSPLAMAAWSTGKSRSWVSRYRDPIANPAMRRQDMCCLHAPGILLLEIAKMTRSSEDPYRSIKSIKSIKSAARQLRFSRICF